MYRLLKVGEELKAGDEHQRGFNNWVNISGENIMDLRRFSMNTHEEGDSPIRRKV